MAKAFSVEVVTPEGRVLQDEVDVLVVPAWDGSLGILANHAPLLCMIRPGELRVRKGGDSQRFAISGGYLHVANNQASVLADQVLRAEQIDPKQAREDLEEAARPETRTKDPESAERAQAWARARLKLASTPDEESSSA